MRYLQFIFIISQLFFSSTALSETWLNLSKVTNTTLNNLVLKLVDAQLASCQRCQANAHAGFVVGLLNDQKAAILGMPDYNDRFSVNCSVSFLQSIEGVNCSFNFTDQGDHKLELGSNVGNVPYAGYVNAHTFNEFFAKTFVNWRSKPFYAIITGLYKAVAFTPVPTPLPTLAPTVVPTPVPTPVPTLAPTVAPTSVPTTAVPTTVVPTTAVPRHRTRTDTPSASPSFSQTISSSSSETVTGSLSLSEEVSMTETGSQSISGSTSQSLSSTGSLSTSAKTVLNSDWAVWLASTGVYADSASQSSRYTTSSGMVTDSYTGLRWQQSSSSGTYTWSATAASGSAQAYCASQTTGGFSDWRLPTQIELASLVDYSVASPYINTAIFQNTPAGSFWTSTVYQRDSVSAWYFNFDNGSNSPGPRSATYYVRCIRPHSAIIPSSRYTDETGATLGGASAQVKDALTGLIWQRTLSGSSYTWSASAATGSAQAYCSALTLSGQSWRLPTAKELATLLDVVVASAAAVDATAFPNTPSGSFWSSTVYQGNTMNAFYGNFDIGPIFFAGVGNSYYVRCVR